MTQTHTTKPQKPPVPIIILITSILLLLIALLISNYFPLTIGQSHITINASRIMHKNFAELVKHSELIVVGKILDTGVTTLLPQPTGPYNPNAPVPTTNNTPPIALSGHQSLPVTIYALQTQQVLKGQTSKPIIKIYLSGGTILERLFPAGPVTKKTYEIEGDSPFTLNQDVLLFLNPIHDNSPYHGTYFISGGPQGRFTLINDHLHPHSKGMKSLLNYQSDTLDGFYKEINSIQQNP